MIFSMIRETEHVVLVRTLLYAIFLQLTLATVQINIHLTD
jgi:hypothetical protein